MAPHFPKYGGRKKGTIPKPGAQAEVYRRELGGIYEVKEKTENEYLILRYL